MAPATMISARRGPTPGSLRRSAIGRREILRAKRFNLLRHGVVPILGVVAFIPAWLTATGIHVFSFISPLTPPISYMAYGIAGFVAVGVVYLIVLWRRDRRRVVDVGIVHLDLPADEDR